MENNFDIIPLNDWIAHESPLIISGPCSAESHEQLLSTALELAKIPQVKIFRSGIWKPRTRPSAFEGVGKEGLKWLSEVKSETGLLTAVEVANPSHVEACLSYNIDILWLGARTVVNPFSVQEIADSLKGTNIPIMVKNPLNPDVLLWLGALERLNTAGIKKIAAIHRGFYYYKHTLYRNQPMWEHPIELKRLVPNLPIICDPSHISGRRDLLKPIAQKAIDLDMSGLMIETHIQPENALTDSNQQITPVELQHLLSSLRIRQTQGNNEFESYIETLRREIDKLDAELLDILHKRMKIVEEIGTYKKQNNITILQIKRWRDMLSERINIGTLMGFDEDFLKHILQIIHEESIRQQEKIFENK